MRFNYKKKIQIIFGLIVLLGQSHMALAQKSDKSDIAKTTRDLIQAYNQKDRTYQVFEYGGEDFFKKDLIYDFSKIAINYSLWRTYGSEKSKIQQFDNRYNSESWTPSGLYERMPKPFRKYALREDGLPHLGVINKWETPVNVGFYLPQYYYGKRDGFTDHNIDKIKSFAEMSVKELSEITGLQIGIYELEDERDKTEDFARIRIVPLKNNLIKNYFKSYRIYRGSHYMWPEGVFVPMYQDSLIGMVEYTPDTLSQVDGYFIPEVDDSIGLAVCNIYPYQEDYVLKALVQECLLRSLGLPSISPNTEKTLLGHWNKAHDKYSKREMTDKNAHFPQKGGNITIDFPASYPSDLSDKEAVPEDITAYDKAMLKLLYCPDIKAGMDMNILLKTLFESNSCFTSILKAKTYEKTKMYDSK